MEPVIQNMMIHGYDHVISHIIILASQFNWESRCLRRLQRLGLVGIPRKEEVGNVGYGEFFCFKGYQQKVTQRSMLFTRPHLSAMCRKSYIDDSLRKTRWYRMIVLKQRSFAWKGFGYFGVTELGQWNWHTYLKLDTGSVCWLLADSDRRWN